MLITITEVRSVSSDLKPFVDFRANFEKRAATPDDQVAIFNVHGTGSNFVVFLDEGKTMEDVEEEMEPYNVVISREDHQRVSTTLESKRLLSEAFD